MAEKAGLVSRPLFQCVPNVSEGRRPEVVAAFAEALAAVPGVYLLDHSADRDHNRSVFTLVGSEAPLRSAVMTLFRMVRDTVDMGRHHGAHPRVGAVDVVPFVPLRGASMEVAVLAAGRLAEEVASELEVPVFLYEESARRPERRALPWIRRGGLEGLRERIGTPEWLPDLGPPRLHPRLGATVIGARRPLIAFNVLLDTPDVEVAKAVARKVRERDGGLRNVRALGLFLAERGRAQVSMNLVDPDRTALYTAFEMVRMEARRFGAQVLSSELIGMLTLEAVTDTAGYYLQIEDFGSDRVLERRLLDLMGRQESPPLPERAEP